MTAIEDLIRRVEALEKELAAMRNKPCNHTWRGGNPDGTGLFECEQCGKLMRVQRCDSQFRYDDIPEWKPLNEEEIRKADDWARRNLGVPVWCERCRAYGCERHKTQVR